MDRPAIVCRRLFGLLPVVALGLQLLLACDYASSGQRNRAGGLDRAEGATVVQPLFADGDLQGSLQQEFSRAAAVVDAVSAEVLLDHTDEEVVAELLQDREVPVLDIAWEQAWTPGPQETWLDAQHDWQYGGAGEGRPIFIAADEVTLHVPFTGDPMLLRLRPSRWSSVFPRAEIGSGELLHQVTGPHLSSEQVTVSFNSFRTSITQYVDATNADVRQHNARLEAELRRFVAARRSRLLDQRQLASGLPFQLRPAGSAAPYPVPVRRSKLLLSQSRPATPFQPEPFLGDAIYEDVLARIVAFGSMVERLPRSVGAMDEEGLRDHLLLVLNGNYEGQVAGEVFNREGRTDVLLRSGDRNVFIAECKVWNGPAKFGPAVNQLLNYLVWRDGKAALVLFIKTGNPTEVVRKADQVVAGHPLCVRRFDPADPTVRIDYLLRSTADPERTVRTALLPVAVAPAPAR